MLRPQLSIVVLARDEEDSIAVCLDSLVEQSMSNIEVLVVDGMSSDGTRAIVDRYVRRHSWIRLIDNPKKITPSAMNAGIQSARANYIAIVSGHAAYARDYFAECVKHLKTFHADQVGSVATYLPRENSSSGRAIAIALTHRIGGGGNARYKTGASEPVWVDTAFASVFRRELFERVGLFREWLVRSQDMDFAIRAQKHGARVLLIPSTMITYYARSGRWESLRYNFKNGYWATYPLAAKIRVFKLRHLAPMLFVLGVVGAVLGTVIFRHQLFWLGGLLGVGAYLSAILTASVVAASTRRDWPLMVALPIAFATLHLGYGAGSLWGLFRAGIGRLKGERADPPPKLHSDHPVDQESRPL